MRVKYAVLSDLDATNNVLYEFRWPLMIDPQGQANRWIRNMEGTKLRIIDLKMPGFLREVENAVQYGFPVLLQDILEEIDPALEPVLSKSILKIGNREVLRLGDKELDYSPDFKLYITTKVNLYRSFPFFSVYSNLDAYFSSQTRTTHRRFLRKPRWSTLQ